MDFILSKIDGDSNEISEGELRKAMLEISDRYGGSTALETSEGRYINKEGVKKTGKDSKLLCNNQQTTFYA